MLPLIGLLVVLAVPQLNPELTPQRAPQPALPKIDENACPFEGCQFGAWTANDQVQLYSTWKTDRKPVVMVAKGEAVTAVTGIHITFEPSEIQVTAPMPDYDLKPGDTIFGYRNYGEGYFSAWFNGYWVEQFDGSGISSPDGGCNRNCTAKLVKPGRMEWWVQIKIKDGTIGWTKETEKFDGKDALGKIRLKFDTPQPQHT
jgi:hypothetical protein